MYSVQGRILNEGVGYEDILVPAWANRLFPCNLKKNKLRKYMDKMTCYQKQGRENEAILLLVEELQELLCQ